MSSQLSQGSVPSISPSLARPAAREWQRMQRILEAAFAVMRERRRLAALDDRMLADIGISRATAEREATRGFFDVPEHRIRRR